MIHFIQEFGILLLIVVVISFIIKLLKQPIIIGYVLSGIIFSAVLIQKYNVDGEQIIILSELGITFMLFLMGLEFDLASLKYLGKDMLISSTVQSFAFFGIGYGLGYAFGFSYMESAYIGILFMFSSTLLVVKWLEDKKESNALFGKITLGTLIIQDIFAILALTILAVIQKGSWVGIVLAPLNAIPLLLIAFILARFALNPMLKFASRFPELLFIFILGICFLFVEIAPLLGYSTTIGAFIAGITLANTIYKHEISARVKPLIIFFNMLFFVGLGFQMDLHLEIIHVAFIILLVFLALVLKPVITYFSLRMLGYDIRTSFLSGIYLAQFSEFGIIIIAAGLSMGIISNKIMASVAIISVILTMIASSYFIKYDKKLYRFFETWITKIDKKVGGKQIKTQTQHLDYNIVFFGYYDLGKEVIDKLKHFGKNIVVIENDPQHIALLKKENIDYIYKSVHTPEFFEEINFKNVEIVISGYNDREINKLIIHEMKKENPKATIITNAKNVKDSLALYKAGADYVIYQSHLNEQQVSVLLEDYTTDIHKVINKKIIDIEKLKRKDENENAIAKEDNLFWDIEKFVTNMIPESHEAEHHENTDESAKKEE